MGGLGKCPCCKEWINLTEHHDTELNVKVMLCRPCHNIIEEYIKVQAICGKKTKKTIIKGSLS